MWQTADRTSRARRLRADQTLAEQRFWDFVRDRRFEGLKFRRQAPAAGFVVDFFCPQLSLVVELDGGVHRLRAAHDAARTARLEAAGFTVLRSANEAFLSKPNVLLGAIRALAALSRNPPPHPSCSASHLLPRGEKG